MGIDIHSLLQWDEHVLEDHLMAAGGAHAQMVPAFDGTNARRIAMHQPRAHQRRRIVAARPHHQPSQPRNAGGVELVAIQPPALRCAPGDGVRQAATGWRAKLRLHPQTVDQRALLQRIEGHSLAEYLRPVGVLGQTQVMQVLHAQHQCGGWLALRHRADHPAQIGQAHAGAAEAL
ncbi:hypothetical protein D3C81_1441310 [compost metagenome]